MLMIDCGACGPIRCRYFNENNKTVGCYTVEQQVTTWYAADVECRLRGGSLLERNDVSDLKSTTGGDNPDYWIGLTKSGWYEQCGGTGKVRVSSNRWSSQSETDSSKRCAVVDKGGRWRTVRCDETHHAICLSDFLVLNTTSSTTDVDRSQLHDHVTAVYDSEITVDWCPARGPITWLLSSWRCLVTSGLAVLVILVTIVIEVYRCGTNRRHRRCKTCHGNQEMHAFPNLYGDHRRESCGPSSGFVDMLPDPNQECYASVDEVKGNRGARHAETGRMSLPSGYDTYGGSNTSMATALTAPLPVTMVPCNNAFYTHAKVCQKAQSQLQIGRPHMEVPRFSSTLPHPDHPHSFYEGMSGASSQRINDVRNQHY